MGWVQGFIPKVNIWVSRCPMVRRATVLKRRVFLLVVLVGAAGMAAGFLIG